MTIWTSQYQQPTIEMLMGEIDPAMRQIFADLRDRVLSTLGRKPRLEWMGITWHWCETLTPAEGGMISTVRLVPDPAAPRVAVTISRRFFELHPPATLPKALLAGLTEAPCIGNQSWCEWRVTSKEMGEAIAELIERATGA